jgi:hypothetical protein
VVSGPDPKDEPRYELIGADVFDDGGPGGVEGTGSGARNAGDRNPSTRTPGFRGLRRAAAWVGREGWREASSSYRSAAFWVWLAAAVVGSAGIIFLIAAWSGLFSWMEPDSMGLLVLAGAAFAVAAAVLGTLRGLHRPVARLFPLRVRLLACLLQALALAALGAAVLLGIRLFPLPAPGLPESDPLAAGSVLPAGPALELLAVVLVLFEVLVFAAIGAGFRAMFTRKLPGAVLAWGVTGVFVLGNLVAVAFVMPAMLVTERTSVPVNVRRDDTSRYVSYECVGELVRSETVLHSERAMWLAAGNPALLYWTVASAELPRNSNYGWIFVSLQRSMEGPYYEVPCINGVQSEELQAVFPLSVVGIAGQLATAAAVTGGAVLAGRRRARA